MDEDSRPVVLVVEDNESLADFYAEGLAEQYDVRTAYGGQEALDRYDESVDVALLDRRMPGVSGDEVLEEIRERPHDCRVAMVTAINPEADIVEMPFDDYLLKPVSKEDLRETVEKLLALSAYDRHVQEYYALSAKRTTLMANQSRDDLADDDAYDSLTDRLVDLQSEFEELREELDYEQLQNAFQVIDFDAPAPEERRVDEG